MDKQSRYTAQEMREKVQSIEQIPMMGLELTSKEKLELAAMLRQAADAEDELAKLSESKNRWMQYQETAAGERNACIDELRKKDAEITQLKARLAAVVKECETEKSKWIPAMECESIVKRSSMVDRYDRILRAAHGEESAPC